MTQVHGAGSGLQGAGTVGATARGRRTGCPWPLAMFVAVLAAAPLHGAMAGSKTELGLPVACELGKDCFVQQMPDLDPGPGVVDPLGGKASYDGHNGWDIRVGSLADVERDVPVVAVADGRVLRVRDGVADGLSIEDIERSRRTGRECGNGVVIRHADGLVSQYCHLKRGSVRVRPAASVRAGDRIGSIGASGLAEFPHVHLSIRQDGVHVDPFTGGRLDRAPARSLPSRAGLFNASARKALDRPATSILGIGLATTPPRLGDLLRTGGPAPPAAEDRATIAWVWAINVEAGDRFRFRLVTPGGTTLIDRTTAPLSRRKANYLAYVGRRQPIEGGTYAINVELLRDGMPHGPERRRLVRQSCRSC